MIRIRRMTSDDLDKIVELERQIFPDPWSLRGFTYEVEHNPFSIPLVMEVEGEIAGYAIIWRIYEEFHIANIAIRPDLQGRKLGTRFLQSLLEAKGECAYAILEVRESNLGAIHLYQKFGFKTIMKRPRYYRNGETALVMQKIFSRPESDHPPEKARKSPGSAGR